MDDAIVVVYGVIAAIIAIVILTGLIIYDIVHSRDRRRGRR